MRVLALLLILAVPAAAKTIELEFPQLVHRVQVAFPENFDPSRKWPAVFYYHGTSTVPDTKFIEHHTDRRDWIVVGMSYRQRGQFTLTPETLADEIQILDSVREYLALKHSLDRKRVYVAGFSKGGWVSGLLVQRDPTIAGAAILGAGHLHRMQAQPGPFRKRTPIFLGVGREDGNYPFSLRAVTFFRSLKAPVIMETWHGLGHTFPREGSPGLRQWLALEVDPTKDLTSVASAWVDERLNEIKEIEDPVEGWLAYRELEDMPYLRTLDDEKKKEVMAARKSLEADEPVATEAKLLSAHRKLLRKEISSHARGSYEELLLDYLRISESAPESRQGKLAHHDHLRVEKILKHYDEQERLQEENEALFPPEEEEPVTPTFPNDGRRIPANPLIR